MSNSQRGTTAPSLHNIDISDEHLATFSQRITCDFDCDAFKLQTEFEIPIKPAHGGLQWTIRVTSPEKRLAYFDLSTPQGTGGGVHVKDAKLWMCVSRIDGNPQRPAHIKERMYFEPPSNLVCLVFSQGQKLWIDSRQLRSLSDYFSTCLSSKFSEGKIRSHGGESDVVPAAKRRKTQEDFEDSDEESDEPMPDQPPVSSSNGTSLPFQEIPISQASFVTYRALLVWQQTGFIRFAPLTSSFLELNFDPSYKFHEDLEKSKKTRQKAIATMVKEDPSLPAPVSPKSIYRLADFLSLPRLKNLAYEAYSNRLTPQGAVHELNSRESSCYPEIRQTVFDYIVANSSAVIGSAAYKSMSQNSGGGGGGGLQDPSLFKELFETLSSSSNKPVEPTGAQKDYRGKTVAGVYFP